MSSNRPSSKRVTQKAVAEKANVSQALVSLVLSGGVVDVAEGTRRQILAAAEELGYRGRVKPVASARQRVLAYMRPVVTRGHHEESWIYEAYDQYYDEIQNRLLEAAYLRNYSLIVRPYRDAEEARQWLSDWGVDGVIWHGEGDSDFVHWIAERYPMVQVWRDTVIDGDGVGSNQMESVIIPMNHLRECGHTRILYAAAYPATDSLRKVRERAYRNYLEEHNLPHWKSLVPQELWALWERPAPFECRAEALANLLTENHPERPTAMVDGDHSTLYYIRYLTARGFRLPKEMSFIGIDNVSASHFSQPRLTSIDNQIPAIAETAVSLLLDRIRTPKAPFKKVYLTPRLELRDSVAILPAAASRAKHIS